MTLLKFISAVVLLPLFSKLSVTFQDQNPIFRSKYNVIGAAPSLQTEKESFCVVFPSSTKREIRHYHVVVVQRRLKNVQKSVMHVQSCCFANLNLLLFFPVLVAVSVVVA